MKYLIKNAKIIDPSNKLDGKFDILISGGKIAKIAEKITDKAEKTIDAEGKTALPGFVDIHVHFRQPGYEAKETILTGSRCAVKGGFTHVLMMPNTRPPIDCEKVITEVNRIIGKDSINNVYIASAITKKREGKELSDFGAYKKLGIKAISDDGDSIADEKIMELALKTAKKEDLLVISHCEDRKLSANGVMNEGFISSKLGLNGMPKSAEYKIVQRDIELAKKTGAKLHIAHVSCKESCEIIKKAKKEGVKVTAETAPHYFALTEENCQTYDTRTKMSPPLRTQKDVEFIKKSLADGTLDAIATDHAPHGFHDKYVEFDRAEFGIIGLETALSVTIMELIEKKIITWQKLVDLMSTNPAKILGITPPQIKEGADADITIIDASKEWKMFAEDVVSKSKNSPFLKKPLRGFVEYVFVGGKLKLAEGKLLRC